MSFDIIMEQDGGWEPTLGSSAVCVFARRLFRLLSFARQGSAAQLFIFSAANGELRWELPSSIAGPKLAL